MGVWWSVGLAVCSVLAALLAAWTWLWTTRLRTNAPGPATLPLLGNVLSFRKLPAVVGHLREMQRQYGDVYRFYVGPKLFLVVTRAEDVHKVLLTTERRDSYFINPLRLFMGDGLINSAGNKWRTHRKAFEPAFRREVVGNFINIFNDGAEFTCRRLAQSPGVEQNVYTVLFQGAIRSILGSTFGTSLDELEPDALKQDELAEMCMWALELSQKMVFRPWMQLDQILFLTADGGRLKTILHTLHKLINLAVVHASDHALNVEQRRAMIISNALQECDGERLLSALELHDEACTFALSGSDTTAATLSNALCLLGLYPEWQDRAVRELEEVYEGGDYLRPSTMEDLRQLVVIESIIKETLRMFATVPNGPHQLGEDVYLAGGRYVAPRGACILVAYWLLHRHPDVFPEPDKFDPGRFLEDGNAVGRPAYSYLPFGAGPRKCIGYRYAMVQMKIVLSALLRHFRILPGSTLKELEEVVLSITGHPVSGFRATCVPRRAPVST